MPDAVETAAQPAEQPIAGQEQPSAVESESLSDHEAQFAPGVERPALTEAVDEGSDDKAGAERDDKGKFKPRHRAKSQEASPEDVPRIKELTKRLRETEAERDALKTRQPEPERPTRAAEPPAARPAPPSATFPAFDVWLSEKGNEAKTFEDFIDARADWRYDQRRAVERADEARTAAEKADRDDAQKYHDALPAALKKYPDFHDIVGDIRVSKVMEKAVIKVGPDVAYYLATHPEERLALEAESLVDPDNPAFPAAVATMRRYLSSLVASSQRSPAPAAASTGSALALAPPVPRPPNPVRTGTIHAADEPPGDDASLADHEKAFGPKRRRA
jgi:hypothetical protein